VHNIIKTGENSPDMPGSTDRKSESEDDHDDLKKPGRDYPKCPPVPPLSPTIIHDMKQSTMMHTDLDTPVLIRESDDTGFFSRVGSPPTGDQIQFLRGTKKKKTLTKVYDI
jgi:hypothetical protein